MTGQFKGLVRATKRGAVNVRQKKGKRWQNSHNAMSRQMPVGGGGWLGESSNETHLGNIHFILFAAEELS